MPPPAPVAKPLQTRPTTVQQPAAGSQTAVAKPAGTAQPTTVAKPAGATQPVPQKPAAGRRLAGALELALEQPEWQQPAEQLEAWWEGPDPQHSGRQLAGLAGAGMLPQQAQQEELQQEELQQEEVSLQRSGRRLMLTMGIKPLRLPTCDFGP